VVKCRRDEKGAKMMAKDEGNGFVFGRVVEKMGFMPPMCKKAFRCS